MTHLDDRTYDQSYLRENRDGQYVHRDYAAHYFRWGWAVSRSTSIGIAGLSLLDIGCGPDLSLLRLAVHTSQLPKYYVGVDLNPLRDLTLSEKRRATLYDRTDFTSLKTYERLLSAHGKFDRISCFEVIEHMTVQRGRQLLINARHLLKSDGVMLLSTPVFNGRAAANHVHEYTVPELREMIEFVGFKVVCRYGTFADTRVVPAAIEAWARDRLLTQNFIDGFYAMWDELRDYYAPDVLSTFVAPLIPDAARNNVWILTTNATEEK